MALRISYQVLSNYIRVVRLQQQPQEIMKRMESMLLSWSIFELLSLLARSDAASMIAVIKAQNSG